MQDHNNEFRQTLIVAKREGYSGAGMSLIIKTVFTFNVVITPTTYTCLEIENNVYINVYRMVPSVSGGEYTSQVHTRGNIT